MQSQRAGSSGIGRADYAENAAFFTQLVAVEIEGEGIGRGHPQGAALVCDVTMVCPNGNHGVE